MNCLILETSNLIILVLLLASFSQVDYYNATGGRWEPLLERVVAQGDREIVRHATKGPAVWGEVGGRGLGGGVEGVGEGEGEMSSVVRLSCFEEDVKVC